MRCFPNRKKFKELCESHDAVPVFRRLLCDSLTPVSAFLRLDAGTDACLFESVVGGERVGRYSFLATDPHMRLVASGNSLSIIRGDQEETRVAENPLQEFRELIESVRVAQIDGLPPFTGGAVGYAGYDVVRYVENLPDSPPDDRGLNDLAFSFYDSMVVFDHITKTLTIVALARPSQFDSNEAAYDQAASRIDQIIEQLSCPETGLSFDDVDTEPVEPTEFTSNFTQSEFENAVRRCKDYIRAGDIFQVVISQRLETAMECQPFEVYRTLRVLNPSPFMFFLRSGDLTLVGSSPEIMCRVVDGQMTVRPLAGTRWRGKTECEDQELERQLLADEKERAEHVMLVDLGRNDVGRVAEYGSIELPDLMVVERYSHVMHISSTVTGQLREDCDAFDALMASLPAGTVSGAPKVRAMQIIDEIEPQRRGPYAGAVGYFDYSQNMDTCIALRTMVIKAGKAYIQAGAGIVADSDPTAEYRETLNKAKGLLRAIELTRARLEQD
ncbi:MAG: anthranilate synthase component I [Planctomycetota bacterium]|nr:anthranilate synthase component I [Planctomycetota bacterium]